MGGFGSWCWDYPFLVGGYWFGVVVVAAVARGIDYLMIAGRLVSGFVVVSWERSILDTCLDSRFGWEVGLLLLFLVGVVVIAS